MRPPPIARAMAAATPPPMPPAAIMVIIIMNGKTSAKPASAGVPSRPKMKVSAMATKVCAIITAVVGPASFQQAPPDGRGQQGMGQARTPEFLCICTLSGRASLSPDKTRSTALAFAMTDTKAPMAKPTVQVENDRVIVTEWRFPPGGHTGWHRHNHDYVVVPVTTGELHIFDGKTTVPAPLRAGVSYARQTGVEHDVINPNNFEFVFVEIELKA